MAEKVPGRCKDKNWTPNGTWFIIPGLEFSTNIICDASNVKIDRIFGGEHPLVGGGICLRILPSREGDLPILTKKADPHRGIFGFVHGGIINLVLLSYFTTFVGVIMTCCCYLIKKRLVGCWKAKNQLRRHILTLTKSFHPPPPTYYCATVFFILTASYRLSILNPTWIF